MHYNVKTYELERSAQRDYAHSLTYTQTKKQEEGGKTDWHRHSGSYHTEDTAQSEE